VKHISPELNEKYKSLCNKVKKSAKQDKDTWIQDQCEEIQKGLQVGEILEKEIHTKVNYYKKTRWHNQKNA
jgi:hypothetical protein